MMARVLSVTLRSASAGSILNPPGRLSHRHRTGAEIGNYFGRRGKGVGGQQDFIARFQVDGVQRQLQRGGTGIHREGMFTAHVGGKLLFELDGDRSRWSANPKRVHVARHHFLQCQSKDDEME